MKHYRMILDFYGDINSIECTIDEVVNSISFVDLYQVEIVIRNEGDVKDA